MKKKWYHIQKWAIINSYDENKERIAEKNQTGIIFFFEANGLFRSFQNWRIGAYPNEKWKHEIKYTNKESYVEITEYDDKRTSYTFYIKRLPEMDLNDNLNDETIII